MEFYKDFINRPKWRGGVWDCPHCGWDMNRESFDWHKYEYVKQVIYGRNLPYGKDSSVFVVAECPKCFELSWIHLDLTYWDGERLKDKGWPKKDCQRIDDIYTQRLKEEKAKYELSPCFNCLKCKGVTYEYVYARIKCGDRKFGVVHVESPCKDRKKITKKPRPTKGKEE